jgi:ATP-binding cassette subfamily C protein CydCD
MSYGAFLAVEGTLTARAVPLPTLLATAAFVPISEIARIGKELSDTMASARRLFAVEDEPVPVRDGKEATAFQVRNATSMPANRPAPMIQYDGVDFTYIPVEAPLL